VTKDLLGLNHGMIRSVSLTSMKLHRTNMSADKTFGSRDSVLESHDVVQNASKKLSENAKHNVKTRHEAGHLHTTRRNNSYTSLSDVLLSRFKQFRQRLPSPLARCSVAKVSAADSKCNSPISPDAGYESDGHAHLGRAEMAVRIGMFPQQTKDVTLKERCSQFVLVGSDCTQRVVTPRKESIEKILVGGSSCTEQVTSCNLRKQSVEELHLVGSDCTQRSRPFSSRKQSLEDLLVVSITPDILSEILNVNPAGVVLLDCRTFVSYHSNHITGALNVTCADSISRKRLTCGRACIGDMICGGEEAKKKFNDALNNRNVQILLYDDNTTDYEGLPSTHPLHVVMTCLHKTGHSPLYLLGEILEQIVL